MEGIEFMPIGKIYLFENLNQNITINVFGFDNKFYPLKIAKLKRHHHINLLYFTCEPSKY